MTGPMKDRPMMDRSAAIQNAATLLSNFCGRRGDGPIQPCTHDHTQDAQAFVRTVEQYAFPELLRNMLDGCMEYELPELMLRTIKQLEDQALVVPPR